MHMNGMEEVDDHFLIQRASAGDAAALALLLQEYEPRLLSYVVRRLPSRIQSIAGPEDIVQDTCYEACRLVRGFVPQGSNSFYRWLIRIANLRIKAAIQKHRTRRTYAISTSVSDDASVLAALEQLVVYKRTPSRSAAAHEFVSRVEQSLNRLIPDYRQVIVHRFIEGLSVEETAQGMSRDSEKVYVLCSRALGALRGQLGSASHFT
jgi:RNA polymerase sigma-70 factor, ECF subfamily